jgi:hypothetical protein
MPENEFTQEQLETAPSLKGRFTSADQSLTELERAVAKHQGLLTDEGKLSEEALKPKPLEMPSGFGGVTSLEDLAPDKVAGVEDAVRDVQGEHAPAAEVDSDLQLEESGLPAPEFSDSEQDIGPGPPPEPMASATIDIGDLLRKAKEPVRCHHCGWDQRDSFQNPRFGEEDKMAFIRHVMSAKGRFFKTYSLFGGSAKVTLRSRTQREVDMALEYTRGLLKNEKLLGMGDMQAQLQRYHVAASIHKITNDDGTQEFKALQDYDKQVSSETLHPVEALDKAVFGGEQAAGLYNIVTALWMEFERLYGWFASRAHEPDFWKAADGAHS